MERDALKMVSAKRSLDDHRQDVRSTSHSILQRQERRKQRQDERDYQAYIRGDWAVRRKHSHDLYTVASIIMSENAVQDLRAAEVAPSINTVQDTKELDQPTTDEDIILHEPPYKPEMIEMKEAAVPDSTPTADIFSVYTARQKKVILVAGSFAAFFSPVSSNIYFPALNTIAKDLHVSLSQINLTVTTYQVSMTVCSPVKPC